MKEVRFPVFERQRKLVLSANLVVYTLILGALLLLHLAKNYEAGERVEKAGRYIFFAGSALGVFFMIKQWSVRKTLMGRFNGTIVFSEGSIVVHEKEYPLHQIEKMEFSVRDYEDKVEYSSRGDFNPRRSNGTGNYCKLKLTSGETVKVYFQLLYEGEFSKMRNVLTAYYLDKKISLLKLTEYLGIEEYEDIQRFKKTLPPTIV